MRIRDRMDLKLKHAPKKPLLSEESLGNRIEVRRRSNSSCRMQLTASGSARACAAR